MISKKLTQKLDLLAKIEKKVVMDRIEKAKIDPSRLLDWDEYSTKSL